MYGLPQASILANERLVKHLATYGYNPTPHTPSLFTHINCPVTFALVVDDFGIKYVDKTNANHLIAAIKSLYTITADWRGTLYCSITLKWDYTARIVDTLMPSYIAKALLKFCVTTPQCPQHLPHAWTSPTYGTPVQYTEPKDTSAALTPAGKTRLQEIIGTLLYYGQAIDSTILIALGSLATAQLTGTENTAQAMTHLLNYCANHLDATVHYHASEMHLHIHSDASYPSVTKARSCAG
jgi:hypothetical protein